MRPQPLVDRHLLPALRAALHPAIASVRSHAEIGLIGQPIGIRCETPDGWGLHIQFVGAAGPGGFADADGHSEPGGDERQAVYAAARAAFESGQVATRTSRTAGPGVTFAGLLEWIASAVKGLDLPVVDVQIRPSSGGSGRPVLHVDFTDGASVFGLPVGVMPPGAVEYAGRAHEIPEVMR